jgi:NNP family nitrate/nitrite transporter-like MFS transporter
MPAIFDSLVKYQGLSDHKAWRVAYVVPFIIITATALGMMLLCDDTPTGKWSERHFGGTETPMLASNNPDSSAFSSGAATPRVADEKIDGKIVSTSSAASDAEAQVDNSKGDLIDELIVAPTWRETLQATFSVPTISLAALYACSFGAELALDGALGSYYAKNFPELGQTKSGNWAAMFGLLNVFTRPLGGYIADVIYRRTSSIWAKKIWLTFLVVMTGVFLLAIGLTNPTSQATMFGLVAGLAVFLDAANGASFALVPHVYPFANGIVSGAVGAFGNLGGLIFNIVFRYNGTHYDRSIWIMGVITLGVAVLQSWTRPIAKKAVVSGKH